jgi:drug/metabolite transporter (DMT)-like permease
VVRRAPRVRLLPADYWPLAGAILAGGVLGPLLLLTGLQYMPASGASLLLNAEGVFTALIAWIVFRENVDRRVAAGMLAIVAGATVLSFSAQASYGSAWPSLAVLAACLCWGIDNNLTRKVALNDATWLAAIKGGVAGPVNLALAFAVGSTMPSILPVLSAMVLGFFAYGVSLVLFIVALRHVGTARAGAYFSTAPFFGGVLALILGDSLTWSLVVAGSLMAVGIWLHLSERHEHEHTHEAVTHDHSHVHDEHHQHQHDEPVDEGVRHRHVHTHEPITHTHAHFPDSDHRHRH